LLTDYNRAAMRRAKYEILEDERSFYGEIPGFQGLYAHAPTLEACREELGSALEAWILICVSNHVPTPVVDDIDPKNQTTRLMLRVGQIKPGLIPHARTVPYNADFRHCRLAEYQPYWAARAELLAKTGAHGERRRAYGMATGLERDPTVRRFLQRRQSALRA